jgi:hypothetical protein
VLIRVDGKNVFIAECKFWKGEKSFLETIDQLLKYLSWRDTKAAVIVFNTNANFSDVLAKILGIVPKHPNCKRELGKPDESAFRYVFAQPDGQKPRNHIDSAGIRHPKGGARRLTKILLIANLKNSQKN